MLISCNIDRALLRERHLIAVVFLVAIAIALLSQWRRRRRYLDVVDVDDAKRSSPPPPPQPNNNILSSQQTTSAKLSAKIDFMTRAGDRYGYANSNKGFIDDWRSIEFPTLISPLKLPPRYSHPRQSPEPPNEKDCYGEKEDDGGGGGDGVAIFSCNESSEPEVYLDYAGSAIPTKTLLSLSNSETRILANPHSQGGGLASDRTLKRMQLTRDFVMKHFGIGHETTAFGLEDLDKEEEDNHRKRNNDATAPPCAGYQLVFTSGATESLRLVAERFPWTSFKITANQASRILLSNHNTDNTRPSYDSKVSIDSPIYSPKKLKSIHVQSILLFPKNVHTSVIGMRQIALQRGARFQCVPIEEVLGATSEWFRELMEGSATSSWERHEKMTRDDSAEEEEKKTEHGVSIVCGDYSKNTTKESMCETIWVHHLLVLPLECNFSGDRFDWKETASAAKEACLSSYVHCYSEDHTQSTTFRICHKWHVLMDTAKAAATSPVKLPTLAGGPDFAVVSFYKMFGAPTGLGALFVKKHRRRKPVDRTNEVSKRQATNESRAMDASYTTTCRLPKTNHHASGGITVERSSPPRQFSGGGSVDVVLTEKDLMVPRNSATHRVNGTMGFDEGEHIDLGVMVHGTEHFRGVASLTHGFRELGDLGGMEAISSHSTCLTEELVRRFEKLLHDNGKPLIRLYGHWKSFPKDDRMSHPINSGPTVAFNLFDRDGSPIGYDEVSRLATLNRPPIQLRTGCFCNPGACQDALLLSDADVLANYASGHVCGDRRGIVNGKLTGAIRASFGKDSLWEDVDALVSFVDRVFVSRGNALVERHGPDESEGNSSDSNVNMKIDSLFVFPIKSCAAMRVNRWPIDRRTGRLAFDREFALVDTSGSAMRLHSHPKMSAIQSKIDLNTKKLTVSAPNHEDLILNLDNPLLSEDHTTSTEDIQVCGTLCKGNIWGGSIAARWFSAVLGVRCWLARHYDAGGETERNGSHDNIERYAYCNEASMLVVSQQSISFLNSVITAQGWGRLVEPRHFRPNIVISSNCEAGDASAMQMERNQKGTNPEDSWEQIFIKGSAAAVELTAVGKCARCQMVDIDPSSGMKGNTLRALAQYRRDRGQINFGTFFSGNVDASEGNAWLEEGSEVHSTSIISKECS